MSQSQVQAPVQQKDQKKALAAAGLVAVPVVAMATQPVAAQTTPDADALTRMEAIANTGTTVITVLIGLGLVGIAYTFGRKMFKKIS